MYGGLHMLYKLVAGVLGLLCHAVMLIDVATAEQINQTELHPQLVKANDHCRVASYWPIAFPPLSKQLLDIEPATWYDVALTFVFNGSSEINPIAITHSTMDSVDVVSNTVMVYPSVIPTEATLDSIMAIQVKVQTSNVTQSLLPLGKLLKLLRCNNASRNYRIASLQWQSDDLPGIISIHDFSEGFCSSTFAFVQTAESFEVITVSRSRSHMERLFLIEGKAYCVTSEFGEGVKPEILLGRVDNLSGSRLQLAQSLPSISFKPLSINSRDRSYEILGVSEVGIYLAYSNFNWVLVDSEATMTPLAVIETRSNHTWLPLYAPVF
jgi:hypothetical protein